MKLAAIYNIFDGHELLEKSILSIRDHVDYVVAAWQDISNYGYEDSETEWVVGSLRSKKLIDKTLKFIPKKGVSPSFQETTKRNWGKKVAKEEGCTHFLHMDVDEFYIPAQFRKAKELIERGNWGGSACRIKVYYKSPTLSFEKLDETWVPFIHKIDSQHTDKYPVYADSTRKATSSGGFLQFPPDQILMHHMSWVRKDIRKKVHNSTAFPNLKKHGEKLFQEWESATQGAHIQCVFNDRLTESENIFGIEI